MRFDVARERQACRVARAMGAWCEILRHARTARLISSALSWLRLSQKIRIRANGARRARGEPVCSHMLDIEAVQPDSEHFALGCVKRTETLRDRHRAATELGEPVRLSLQRSGLGNAPWLIGLLKQVCNQNSPAVRLRIGN
jgi:hypothetical protein